MKNVSIKLKLSVLLLIVGVIPLMMISFISIHQTTNMSFKDAFARLQTLTAIKNAQMETYLKECLNDISILTEIASSLGTAIETGDLSDAHADLFKKYIDMRHHYDFLLIKPDGYCFYTVAHEAEYQTNLINGKYAYTGLGKLVRRALQTKQYGFSDFQPYPPSNNEPAAFIAQPVIEDGKIKFVVALQLSIEQINRIMQQRDGLGQTGESYLIGSDMLMRSDSFLDPVHHSVKASFANPGAGKVDTLAVREALTGKTGSKIIMDYNGNTVLSAYAPLRFDKTTFAVITEIDKAEINRPLKQLNLMIIMIVLISVLMIIPISLFVIRSIFVQGIGDSIGNQVVERQLSMIRSEIDDLLNKIRVSK